MSVAKLIKLLSITTALTFVTQESVQALPSGGQVSAGQAAISSNGSQVTVTQSSNKAVLDWNSFNVGADERVVYSQPSASSIALNRIHDANPTNVQGNITANGKVWIVNPNGVVFGQNAQVNVAGLVASTADISNANFMNGNYAFDKPGNPTASIVNQGSITVKQAGLAALVAPNVSNEGNITAQLGKVHLASGDTFALDMYGDGLVGLAVSDKVAKQLVKNSGSISARGGHVSVTAAAGAQVVESLVNNTGIIEANSAMEQNGSIVLYAEGSNSVAGNVIANKGKKTGNSEVLNSGSLSATGLEAGQTGGTITVSGDHLAILSGATINASGSNGGGVVQIGGAAHGAGTTPTAKRTIIQANTSIKANATLKGKGGQVTVWADDRTDFAGNIEAKGGIKGGDGGFVETSGKHVLRASGTVEASAPHGNAGTWLLDPNNIIIQNDLGAGDVNVSGDPNFSTNDDSAIVTTNSIINNLNNGTSVTITTSSNGNNGEAGNIEIANSILKSGGGDAALTMNAAGSILFDNSTSISSNSGLLNVYLQPAGIQFNGNNTINANGGNISLNAPVTLNGSGVNILSSGTGQTINISGIEGGGYDLNVSTGGTVNIAGSIGNNGGLGNLYIAGGTGISMQSVTSVGDISLASDGIQSFNSLTASGSVSLDTFTTSKTLGFGSGSGDVVFSDSLLNNISAGNGMIIGSAGNGGIEINSNSIFQHAVAFHSSGTISVDNATTLGGITNFTSSDNINFANTINGPYSLGISGGSVNIGADIGGVTPISSLSVTGNNGINLSANITTNGGGIVFNNPVTLTGSSALTDVAGGNINLGIVNGAYNLGALTSGTINLNGIVGGSIALNSLNVNSALINIFHDISTGGGGMSFTGPVALRALASIVDSGYGNINFSSTIDGSNGPIITTNGNINIAGDVGDGTPVSDLTLVASHISIQHANAVNTIRFIADYTPSFTTLNAGNYVGFETLDSARTIGVGGYGDIILSDSLLSAVTTGSFIFGDNANNAGLNIYDNYAFSHPVTANSAGNIHIFNALALGANTNMYSIGGDIIFDGSINGAHNLGLVAGNSVHLGGDIGGSTALTRFNAQAGTSIFMPSNTTIAGSSSFSGPVVFNVDSTLRSTNSSALSFDSTIEYNRALTISTGGNVTVNGDVSGNTILSGLNIISGNTISLQNVISNGNINFVSDHAPSFGTINTNGKVGFDTYTSSKTIGVGNGTGDVILSDGALGNITATNGFVFGVNTHNAGINIDSSGAFNGPVAFHSLGAITVANAVTLGGNASLSSSTGNISFANPIDGPYNLDISTNGAIAFNGDIGASTALTGLTTTGSSSLALQNATVDGNVALSLIGTITLNGAVSVGNHIFSAISTTGDIIMSLGSSISSTASGTSVLLAARTGNFTNQTGAGALSTSGGRWLIYSTNPTNNALDSLSQDFNHYSCFYGAACSIPASGNGLIYSYTPLLTVNPYSIAVTYGNAIPSLAGYSYSLSGYLDSIDSAASSISGSVNGTTDYTHTSNAGGDYYINHTSGTLSSNEGYGFTYVNNATGVSVGNANLSITANAGNKNYGDALTFAGTEFGRTGLLNSDTVTSVSLTSSGAAGTANAGTYNITASGASGSGLSNYNITYNTGTLTVNKASLSITADADNKNYGDSLTFAGTEFSTSALKNSDVVTSVNLASSGTATTANAGSYSIVASGASGTGLSNYNITYNSGTLTVDKANLSITANAGNKTYGDTLIFTDTEFSTGSLLNSDTVTSVAITSSGAAATANVGSYSIIASGAAGVGISNYNITYNLGTLTVGQAPLSITANPQTKIYGDNFIFAGTEFGRSGLRNNDSISSINLSSNGAVATANAGSYGIAASGAAGSGLTNYNITYNTGVFTVGKAGLTITANAENKTYGDGFNFIGIEYSTIGLRNSDTVTAVNLSSSGSAASVNAGNYSTSVSGAAGSGLSNYNITYNDALFTVNKAALAVSGDNVSKPYGDPMPVLTYSYHGLVNNDTESVFSGGLATPANSHSAPSNYSILQGSLQTGANYTINYTPGTLHITGTLPPAPAIITETPVAILTSIVPSSVQQQSFYMPMILSAYNNNFTDAGLFSFTDTSQQLAYSDGSFSEKEGEDSRYKMH